MSETESTGAGIVAPTPPSDDTGQVHLEMDLSILLNFHERVHLFTRDTTDLTVANPSVTVHKVSKPFAESAAPLRIGGYLLYQLTLALLLLQHRRDLDIVLFRGFGQLIPLLAAKVAGAITVTRVAGVASYHYQSDASLGEKFLNEALEAIQTIMCELTDVLTVASPSIVEFAEIGAYEQKTVCWQFQFYDLEQFAVTVPFPERDQTVGHVGQLSDLKGSTDFARAICAVGQGDDVAARVVGDGPKRDKVKEIFRACDADAVYTGRVDREQVPAELNQLQLLVLPSRTEGMPKIVIEAMACGTPVLATSVGGIPDVVTDGETGFLLDDTDPDMIATRVAEILDRDDLQRVSAAARAHVEDHVSYRSAVEEYHELLATMTPYDLGPLEGEPAADVEIDV